jgi:hypothetical protein
MMLLGVFENKPEVRISDKQLRDISSERADKKKPKPSQEKADIVLTERPGTNDRSSTEKLVIPLSDKLAIPTQSPRNGNISPTPKS